MLASPWSRLSTKSFPSADMFQSFEQVVREQMFDNMLLLKWV